MSHTKLLLRHFFSNTFFQCYKTKSQEAVKKLYERQKKELKETEELIKSLELDIREQQQQGYHNSYNNSYNNSTVMISTDDCNNTNTTSSSTSSIAASLLASFDYGFVSRSEGCRFEDVDDFSE
jgi:hypothetical protein